MLMKLLGGLVSELIRMPEYLEVEINNSDEQAKFLRCSKDVVESNVKFIGTKLADNSDVYFKDPHSGRIVKVGRLTNNYSVDRPVAGPLDPVTTALGFRIIFDESAKDYFRELKIRPKSLEFSYSAIYSVNGTDYVLKSFGQFRVRNRFGV